MVGTWFSPYGWRDFEFFAATSRDQGGLVFSRVPIYPGSTGEWHLERRGARSEQLATAAECTYTPSHNTFERQTEQIQRKAEAVAAHLGWKLKTTHKQTENFTSCRRLPAPHLGPEQGNLLVRTLAQARGAGIAVVAFPCLPCLLLSWCKPYNVPRVPVPQTSNRQTQKSNLSVSHSPKPSLSNHASRTHVKPDYEIFVGERASQAGSTHSKLRAARRYLRSWFETQEKARTWQALEIRVERELICSSGGESAECKTERNIA